MAEEAHSLAFRESFAVAEAVVGVVREHCDAYADDGAVWEAFINWTGRKDAEYLRGVRSGGQFIFYALVQDLYGFAEQACGRDVTLQVGSRLAGRLFEMHVPELIRAMLSRKGALLDQLQWLIGRFMEEATGEIYRIRFDPSPEDGLVRVSAGYRQEGQTVAYLKRSGHNPERAFARSCNVIRGCLLKLLSQTVYGFRQEQFVSELRDLVTVFSVRLTGEARFNYEGLVDLLLHYVGQLREHGPDDAPEAEPGGPDTSLSATMGAVERLLGKAARSEETVLLRGESGTGKSYHARRMHRMSSRRAGPFVEVNLTSDVGSDNMIQSNLFGHVRGAFTGAHDEKQGLFALAEGGTIFLDEVGDASAELQAKLLRVIEQKSFRLLGGTDDVSVDVRIIAATNRDLAGMVASGAFRQDLYYRLKVVPITLPPLRERPEDLPELVRTLFGQVRGAAGREDLRLGGAARRLLAAYDWPGNIRELENVLRRAVAVCDGTEIGSEDLPPEVGAGAPAVRPIVDEQALLRSLSAGARGEDRPTWEQPDHVDHARREYLRVLIRHHHGNLSKIAGHWDRSSEDTLLKLVRRFGLEDELQAARRGQ